MPRASRNGERGKSLEEWYPQQALLGEIAITVMELGAYVGLFHNYANGINLNVMYENDKERFYATNSEELREIPNEVRQWVKEIKERQESRRKGNRQKA